MRLTSFVGLTTHYKIFGNGLQHSTVVAFPPRTYLPWVQFPAFPFFQRILPTLLWVIKRTMPKLKIYSSSNPSSTGPGPWSVTLNNAQLAVNISSILQRSWELNPLGVKHQCYLYPMPLFVFDSSLIINELCQKLIQ